MGELWGHRETERAGERQGKTICEMGEVRLVK